MPAVAEEMLEHSIERSQPLHWKEIERSLKNSTLECFTLRDLMEHFVDASEKSIRKALNSLKKQGIVECTGRGRGAK